MKDTSEAKDASQSGRVICPMGGFTRWGSIGIAPAWGYYRELISIKGAVQDFNSWQHIFTGSLISNILYKQSPHFSTDSYGVNWRPCWQGSLSGVAGSHLLETNNWVLGLFILLTGKCPFA